MMNFFSCLLHSTSYTQNDNDDKKVCHIVCHLLRRFLQNNKLFLFPFYDEHFWHFGSEKSFEEITKSFWQMAFAFILSAWLV